VNVMPALLELAGTARCFSKATQTILDTRMHDLAHALAAMHGATAEFTSSWGTIPLVNHPDQTSVAAAAARDMVGDDAVETDAVAVTGGEDFAFMLDAKPGAFIMIGQGVAADGKVHGLHTPKYDFNDAIIPLGAAWWVKLVEQELRL